MKKEKKAVFLPPLYIANQRFFKPRIDTDISVNQCKSVADLYLYQSNSCDFERVVNGRDHSLHIIE
jgi:hypothetical protein